MIGCGFFCFDLMAGPINVIWLHAEEGFQYSFFRCNQASLKEVDREVKKQGRIHDCPRRGRLGRGSIELGRGSNEFGRSCKGCSHTKSKSVTDRPTDRHSDL